MAVSTQPDRRYPSPIQTLMKGASPDYKTMSRDSSPGPATPDRASRSSFASIRENDSDLAQTFSSSKISSLSNPANEEAVEDLPTSPAMVETHFYPPVTRPQSKLQGYWHPADNFKGWKGINVRGKLASKSFGDLQVLNMSWNRAPNVKVPSKKGSYPPGQAPFERLPIELLSKWASHSRLNPSQSLGTLMLTCHVPR